MSYKIQPTGRIRYRVQERLFRKPLIVLQIEERHKGHTSDMYGDSPEFDYCSWRDADIGDISIKTDVSIKNILDGKC